jgi:hypothetical protein
MAIDARRSARVDRHARTQSDQHHPGDGIRSGERAPAGACEHSPPSVDYE